MTEIDGVFYMTYTAYGREFYGVGEPTHSGGGILPMIARSTNLITWERLGPIVRGEDNKDHVLFPRRSVAATPRCTALAERLDRLFRRLAALAQADMAPIYGPRTIRRPGTHRSVGSNGVPIETAAGWLPINHGYNEDHVYKFGVCLVDPDDPTRVHPAAKAGDFFWPEELWELRGDVPNVVFSCANVVVEGTVLRLLRRRGSRDRAGDVRVG